MTNSKYLYILLVGVLLCACNEPTEVKIKEVTITSIEQEKDEPPPPPPPPVPTGLTVSAHLIYTDSTISTFDVLNDRTIALWNTVIGAGDAEKPSEKVKIVLTGELDGLNVIIHNGKRKVENHKLPDFSGDYELIINDTGCEEVKVVVTKAGKIVYKGNIPFKCGE